jgi:O-antigen ligase
VRESFEDDLPDLRLARLLYYSGMALIGQLVFRPIIDFTISDWLFFFSFVATSSALILGRSPIPVRLPSLLLAGILIFTIGGLISSFDSETPIHSIGVIVRLLYLTVVWFWLGTVVLRRIEHVRNAIVLWVSSAALSGFGAVIQLVAGDVIPGGHVNWDRMTGFTQHVSDLGGVTSAAFVPALMLTVVLAKTSLRMVLGGSLLILVAAGLLLSGSIGSVLAALAATALWFGVQPTRASRVVAVLAVAAAAFAFYSAQNAPDRPSAIQRILRFGSASPDDPNRTLNDRLEIYGVAVKRIEQNPVIGVGLDQVAATPKGEEVHNIVLGTWFSTGLLGLIGLFLVFLVAARTAWATTLAADSADERALAFALVCAFAAFIVFLMSEPALYTRYGWVSAALLFALRSVQLRTARSSMRTSDRTLVGRELTSLT